MKQIIFSLFLLGSFINALLLTGCSSPACIQCKNVSGYPNTTICRDAYETALTDETPSWKEYADKAISKGCVVAD
ncbi:MAG: hypothetical protein N2167_09175 [Flavobacteriales bacterium]|nr:hypothetical protein [Flavobacteriales bacterium]